MSGLESPDDVGILASNLLLLDVAERSLGVLEEAGIQACVVKGAALLATVSADELGTRSMSDVDLVVTPGRAGRAVSTLARALDLELIPDSGLELQPRPGVPGRGVVRIDVHDSLHHGGRRETVRLLQSVHRAPSSRSGRGGGLLVPEPELHLLHVLAHAILHQCFLKDSQALDLARLAAVVQPDRLRREVASTGLLAPLRVGLEAARDRLPPLHSGRLARLLAHLPVARGATALEAALLRRRIASGRPPGRAHLVASLRYGDPAATLRHLVHRAWLGPARAHLVDAGLSGSELERVLPTG